ncbi:MAG: V-type ATP synthase subunit D [Oscillospiraceae bacterium]
MVETRRRVNALEHVMIPRYQETIHFISGSLKKRSASPRPMKVKGYD